MIGKRTRRLAAAAILALGLPLAALGADDPLSPEQSRQVEKIVRDYLLANPDVVMEALRTLELRKKESEEAQLKQTLTVERDQLLSSPDSPVLGNPKGDVSVVEFFDYRCPYCKSVMLPLLKAIADDGNVRLVLKEFPILGPESQFAAQAALASVKQGKYQDFHVKLMGAKGALGEAVVMEVAKSVGLDTDRLKSDMNDPAIKAEIERTYRLADALRITGTPTFVVGGRLVRGALPIEELMAIVRETRKEKG
ncbi:MAG: DsbA family protein [Alphaproteobacteria bacterium]